MYKTPNVKWGTVTSQSSVDGVVRFPPDFRWMFTLQMKRLLSSLTDKHPTDHSAGIIMETCKTITHTIILLHNAYFEKYTQCKMMVS